MSTVREVITEAFCRANLVPRKRDLPADMLVTGLNLLQGVLQDFSNKKYIQAYKSEFEFVPNKEKSIIGPYTLKQEYKNNVIIVEYETDRPEASAQLVNQYVYAKASKAAWQCERVVADSYAWMPRGNGAFLFDFIPDVEILDLMTPTQAYFKDSNSAVDWVAMPFISYDQLYECGYSDIIVSWKPVNEGTYELFVKPRFLQQHNIVKVIYNIVMNYKDNDVISLPAPYLELLTRALAYKVAITYPRTDSTKVSLLKTDLEELTANLEASNASQRILTRSGTGGKSINGAFLDGSFISNRWY